MRKFSVGTFNILAPIWKRMRGYVLESSDPIIWKKRMKSCFEYAEREVNADILSIQEFWCCKEMDELVYNVLGDNYHIVTLKRTHWKNDGVGIFVKKSRFRIVNEREIKFNGQGNRVALLLHLASVDDDFEVIVGTTHLTFPHNYYDEKILRVEQLDKTFRNLDHFRSNCKIKDSVPFIFSGDLNVSDHEGDLGLQFIENKMKMKSSYFEIHKNHDFLSHLNHNGQKMGCDFIYFKNQDGYDDINTNNIEVEDCYLVPKKTKKFENYTTIKKKLSDHVPLKTIFSYKKRNVAGLLRDEKVVKSEISEILEEMDDSEKYGEDVRRSEDTDMAKNEEVEDSGEEDEKTEEKKDDDDTCDGELLIIEEDEKKAVELVNDELQDDEDNKLEKKEEKDIVVEKMENDGLEDEEVITITNKTEKKLVSEEIEKTGEESGEKDESEEKNEENTGNSNSLESSETTEKEEKSLDDIKNELNQNSIDIIINN